MTIKIRSAAHLACLILALGFSTACKEDQVLYTYNEDPATPLPSDRARSGSSVPTEAIPDAAPTPQPPFMRNAADGDGVDIALLPRPDDRDRLPDGSELTPVEAPGVVFDAPASWGAVDVSGNAMRANQLTIPGEAGPGELVVFHFGPGQGGDVAANLNRWIGQIDLEPNTTPLIFQGETNGLTVTELYTVGTLRPSTMGVGPTEPQPNSALYGIIVEDGPEGSLFIKVTGPRQTLEAARPALVTMIESLRASG